MSPVLESSQAQEDSYIGDFIHAICCMPFLLHAYVYPIRPFLHIGSSIGEHPSFLRR